MKFNVYRKELNGKQKLILETSESHKALRKVMDTFNDCEEEGRRIKGNLMIKVKERKPKKSENYVLVKNGIEDAKRGFEFVRDYF